MATFSIVYRKYHSTGSHQRARRQVQAADFREAIIALRRSILDEWSGITEIDILDASVRTEAGWAAVDDWEGI